MTGMCPSDDADIDRPLARVRKLLHLASSPNQHEAEVALQRARELMDQHKIAYEDIAEDVTEAVEQWSDGYRCDLVRAIAGATECAALTNKSGELGFRGSKVDVERACEIYRSCAREIQGREVSGPDPSASEAWQICFWMGFMSLLGERLRDLTTQAQPAMPEPTREQLAASPLVRQALSALEELAYQGRNYVEQLREQAYETGRSSARRVEIGALRIKPKVAGLLRSTSRWALLEID